MHKALASSPAPRVGLIEEGEKMREGRWGEGERQIQRERQRETEWADRNTQSNGTHLVCLYR